jgi:hypothetical protein
MEGCFIDEGFEMRRVEVDRLLRSYRKMNEMLRSSRTWGRHFGDGEIVDDAALRAQMFSLRNAILSLEDSCERMALYHYYIKAQKPEMCAKLLGVSRRTFFRVKGKGLDNLALKMILNENE